MRLPNGYGSVYKIKERKRVNSDGKMVPVRRRNPWVARVSDGWITPNGSKNRRPKYVYVGYYATRAEAMQALEDYKRSDKPTFERITFEDTYEAWAVKKYADIKDASHYKYAFKTAAPIHRRVMSEINFPELQSLIDQQKTNTAANHLKILIVALFEYGYIQGTVSADMKERVKYLDISHCVSAKKNEHVPFTREEVEQLWQANGTGRDLILIMIYTGVRIGEFLNLKMSNVHFDERYFSVTDAKTAAGIREVPIADRILPLMERCAGSTYFIDCRNRRQFVSRYWDPALKALGLSHLPHDTRHTCATFLEEAGVDDRIVKAILGHKRLDITGIYSHIGIEKKIKAINTI
jgi:integrase